MTVSSMAKLAAAEPSEEELGLGRRQTKPAAGPHRPLQRARATGRRLSGANSAY